jgi:transposase
MAATYYPSDVEYGYRKLLRVRHKLVQMRQQAINSIRGLLNAYLIPAGRGALYTARGRERLRSCRLPTLAMQAAFDALVHSLDALQEQVHQLDRQIESVAREPAVTAVQDTLPQIGAQSAATLFYELGDVRRFRSTRAVAAYAGLVPTVIQSGDKAHHGRLTRQGNRELRLDPQPMGGAAARARSCHSKLGGSAPPPSPSQQNPDGSGAPPTRGDLDHALARGVLRLAALPRHCLTERNESYRSRQRLRLTPADDGD